MGSWLRVSRRVGWGAGVVVDRGCSPVGSDVRVGAAGAGVASGAAGTGVASEAADGAWVSPAGGAWFAAAGRVPTEVGANFEGEAVGCGMTSWSSAMAAYCGGRRGAIF